VFVTLATKALIVPEQRFHQFACLDAVVRAVVTWKQPTARVKRLPTVLIATLQSTCATHVAMECVISLPPLQSANAIVDTLVNTAML